jgi:heme exporter protein C
LTTVTITILIYVAYMLFRNGIDERRTRALFGNIYALFAFLSVPLTYYSARWFRSIHPIVWDGANTEAEGDFAIGASMSQTLTVAVISFSLLFSALMIQRWRQLRTVDRIEEMREELE